MKIQLNLKFLDPAPTNWLYEAAMNLRHGRRIIIIEIFRCSSVCYRLAHQNIISVSFHSGFHFTISNIKCHNLRKRYQPAHWIHFPKPGNWLSDARFQFCLHPFLHKAFKPFAVAWHTPPTRMHSRKSKSADNTMVGIIAAPFFVIHPENHNVPLPYCTGTDGHNYRPAPIANLGDFSRNKIIKDRFIATRKEAQRINGKPRPPYFLTQIDSVLDEPNELRPSPEVTAPKSDPEFARSDKRLFNK